MISGALPRLGPQPQLQTVTATQPGTTGQPVPAPTTTPAQPATADTDAVTPQASHTTDPTALSFPATGAQASAATTAAENLAETAEAGPVSSDGAQQLAELGGQVRERMRELATGSPEKFETILKQIYGERLSAEQLNELTTQARDGQFPLPANLRLVDADVLQGKAAAYSPENGGTVYLDRALSPEQQLEAFTQEVGHHVDAQLGGGDTPGDEGAMLARALTNNRPLSSEELTQLREVSDTSTIFVDGRNVEVENVLPLIPVALWVGRAAAETGLDAFIEYALAAVTGEDPPGFWTHAGNFGINMVGLGMANRGRKIGRIVEAIDRMKDTFRTIAQVPGGRQIVEELGQMAPRLESALRGRRLGEAKDIFSQLVNRLGDAHRLARQRTEMLSEMTRNGVRYNADELVQVSRRQGDNKVVFLENGRLQPKASGLAHIIAEHASNFADKGIRQSEIPDLLMAALTRGRPVGVTGTDRTVYQVVFNGRTQNVGINVSNNGYIVGANPVSTWRPLP